MTAKRVLSALAVATVVMAPLASGEGPTEFACDAQVQGKAVCTGIAVGATVECGDANAAVAACDYTFGWIAQSFSPTALPGEGLAGVAYEVDVCSSLHGCAVAVSGEQGAGCSWLAPTGCTLDGEDGDSLEEMALELGECVTVTVTLSATSTAWVPPGPLPYLASAEHDDAGEGADQVCHLDDGR